METWSVVVDASGSMLSGARAQIAGECVRTLLQAGAATRTRVFCWKGDSVSPWPPAGFADSAAWEQTFGGGSNFAAFAAWAAEQEGRILLVSDGYAVQDAPAQDVRTLQRKKKAMELLLLEQERTLAGVKRLFPAEAVFAPEEILVLAERLKNVAQPMPKTVSEIAWAQGGEQDA